jgi:hypothetical protein
MKKVGNSFELSATDLVGHLHCRHLTALDRAVAEGALARPKVWDLRAYRRIPAKPSVHATRASDSRHWVRGRAPSGFSWLTRRIRSRRPRSTGTSSCRPAVTPCLADDPPRLASSTALLTFCGGMGRSITRSCPTNLPCGWSKSPVQLRQQAAELTVRRAAQHPWTGRPINSP